MLDYKYIRARKKKQAIFCEIYESVKNFYNFPRNLFTNPPLSAIIAGMKKVIEVEDLCCKRCAERAEKKLLLLDGVTGAKANYKRNTVFVESVLSDGELAACLEDAGFVVRAVRPRKGIFG